MFDVIKLNTYGSSHGECVGVKVSGLEGIEFKQSVVNSVLCRRRAGGIGSTKRIEDDIPQYFGEVAFDGDKGYISGDFDVRIKNKNVINPSNEMVIPRPSHADLVAFVRYGKIDSGGGEFSGRMTAPLCVVGGIAKSYLKDKGIKINAYLSSIGDIDIASYQNNDIAIYGFDDALIDRIESDKIGIIEDSKKQEVERYIDRLYDEGDSVGGVVECIISGVKIGALGGSLFDGLEGKISSAVYGVPAVKGVEFGSGFDMAYRRGSEVNDKILSVDGQCASNNSGGISGGISNGMPITLRVVIKPTPSIRIEQDSVNIKTGENVKCSTNTRNDVCIAIRATACIEAVVSIVILDEVLKVQKKHLSNVKTDDKTSNLSYCDNLNTLQKTRKDIDEIDREIAKLMDRRLDLVQDVATFKQQNNLEILDSNRERDVLDNVANNVSNEHKDIVLNVYNTILSTSKQKQNRLICKD